MDELDLAEEEICARAEARGMNVRYHSNELDIPALAFLRTSGPFERQVLSPYPTLLCVMRLPSLAYCLAPDPVRALLSYF